MTNYTYSVLLVDDEPIAIQMMTAIIDCHCPEIRIEGTAETAEECMHMLQHIRPDMLITDIQMPGISGLDLIQEVQTLSPDTRCVVISGYQEFEYAKRALTLHVSDYLLKPLVPSEFTEVMHRVEANIDQILARKRQEVVFGTDNYSPEDMARYFSDASYYMAFSRKNGLPRHFITQTAVSRPELGDMFYLDGRDVRELFYLIPAEVVPDGNVKRILEHTFRRESKDASFITLLIIKKPVKREEIQKAIWYLFRQLDERLIPGRSQILELEMNDEKRTAASRVPSGMIRAFRDDLEQNAISRAIHEIEKTGEYCMKNQVSQRNIERILNEMLDLSQDRIQGFSWNVDKDEALNDLLMDADTCEALFAGFMEMYEDSVSAQNQDGKLDSEQYIDRITQYIENHISEQLTVGYLSRYFGISPTYLSQLFQKYRKQSPGNYIVAARMRIAKKILEEDDTMMIRDVAARVGYQDQFYFSRVFKNVVGVTPSEYGKETVSGRKTEV